MQGEPESIMTGGADTAGPPTVWQCLKTAPAIRLISMALFVALIWGARFEGALGWGGALAWLLAGAVLLTLGVRQMQRRGLPEPA